MSGLPYPEGVSKVIELLDSVAKCDTEIKRIQGEVSKLEDLQGQRRSLWKEYVKLMDDMDVDTPGNFGFENRAAWFLMEMRRQIKRKGDQT